MTVLPGDRKVRKSANFSDFLVFSKMQFLHHPLDLDRGFRQRPLFATFCTSLGPHFGPLKINVFPIFGIAEPLGVHGILTTLGADNSENDENDCFWSKTRKMTKMTVFGRKSESKKCHFLTISWLIMHTT